MQTPYFVINKDELDEQVHQLKAALDRYWSNYIVGYSYKTNSVPWVIRYFAQQGFYAEVVSDDEYGLARKIGYTTNILYNGPIKSKETFLEALENACYINIDTKREIDWLPSPKNEKTYHIGVRVNFDIERYCDGQSACGDEGGRFGFCYENGEFEKAVLAIQKKGYRIAGIHLHTSSKTRSVDIYRAIARMACQLSLEYALDLEYIDIGGGYFGGLPDRPQFADYFAAVQEILQQQFDPRKTKLIVEPGMALIGSPISYVTSVIDVKDTTYNRFVVTDGSRTNIDPLMGKKNYFHCIEYADAEQRAQHPKQVISGFTCMEPDRLFILSDAPELRENDRIIYNKVGAYTMCLSPQFIKYSPAVYVRQGEEMKLVRKKWTPEEYTAGDIG